MENITKITMEAVKRYFNSLFKFGYKNYKDTNKLLALVFLEELLSYDLFGFLEEKDYNTIIKAINGLAGTTCLIDFPSYATYNTIIRKQNGKTNSRVSDLNILRISEQDVVRVKV